MATSALVPLSEYLRTSYRPDCDWVDGEVRERVTGEGLHSAMLTALLVALRPQEESCGILALPILRIRTSAFRYRVADICVVRRDGPFEDIVTIAPLLCVEVLSPGDGMSAMMEKINDYLAMGVAMVWLVDPWRRKAYVVDECGCRAVTVLTVPGTGVDVPVAPMFAELDELEGRDTVV